MNNFQIQLNKMKMAKTKMCIKISLSKVNNSKFLRMSKMMI